MDNTQITLVGGGVALALVWIPTAYAKVKPLFAPDAATKANTTLSGKMLHWFFLAQLPEVQSKPEAVSGLQSVLGALTEYKPANPTPPTPNQQGK